MSRPPDLELTPNEAAYIAFALWDFASENRDADPEFWEWLETGPNEIEALAEKINSWAHA